MPLDIINVVDLEATCWNKAGKQGLSEIIEIGISEFEISTGNILSTESIYVRPEHSKVSEFCYNLTGIDQRTLDDSGIEYWRALLKLEGRYQSRSRIWASYGEYDVRMVDKQCQREYLKYPFGAKHINVKTLFALKYKLQDEIGMASALKMLNIPLEGRHHSGGDDSKNIAKILREILK